MIVGLGHPRCGTGFAASLLAENGIAVGHEGIGPAGIISWMQVARRNAGPWGNTLTDYPNDSTVLLVARSPLAALNSVATENQQIRSIGFRSQVIWQRRGVDLFAAPNQTAGDGVYDFFGWAVMSLAYWYDVCLEENPGMIFRIERPADDDLLSEFLGRRITREGINPWRNEHGPNKKSVRLIYPLAELRRVPRPHLTALINTTHRLG
ncbi:MAG: hypothetical protein WCI74_18290, partial [Actinomycetes bacterium]